MELGGKSPQLLFADADIEAAVPVVINAIIQNGGQTCSAGSRVLIQRSAYAEFSAAVAERFAKVRAGAHDRDLDMGAMNATAFVDAFQWARNASVVSAREGSSDSPNSSSPWKSTSVSVRRR